MRELSESNVKDTKHIASDELYIDENANKEKDLKDQNTPEDVKISDNLLEITENKGRN